MPRVLSFNNCACLKCSSVMKEMIRVGAMIFCHRCYEEEFGDITVESKIGGLSVAGGGKYSYWLKKYNEEVSGG